MSRRPIIGLFILLCCACASAEELAIVGGGNENGLIGSRFSYLDGLMYEFGMTHEQANALSVWKRGDKNPPISPREAIDVAKGMLTTLNLTKEKWSWELHYVQLAPIALMLDRADGIELWQYVIAFQRWPNPKPMAWSGVVPEIRLVVLMNGQAIKPLISQEKR